MSTWQAIVGPTTYSLSGGNPFHRLQATGLGIPNVRNIKQRGPFQDGSTRRGFRIDERYLNLMFLLQGASCAQADTYRDQLIEIFKPLTDTPCQLKVTRDDGVIKYLDSYAVGVLDFPETEAERFAATQRVLVQLEAPNPFWYGALVNVPFPATQTATQGFHIPMQIPWVQSSGSSIDVTSPVVYTGNYKAYPILVLTGPGSNPVITNITTNETLDFSGVTLTVGQTRTIDLRYGSKTVKDQAGVLKNSELTPDSSLGTFHLAASPEATGGINDIQVQMLSNANANSSLSMQFYPMFTHL